MKKLIASDTEYLKTDTIKDLLKNLNLKVNVNRLNVDRIEEDFDLKMNTELFLIKNENENFDLVFEDNQFKLV